jgi:hypothetical protein
MAEPPPTASRFVVCIDNGGYPAATKAMRQPAISAASRRSVSRVCSAVEKECTAQRRMQVLYSLPLPSDATCKLDAHTLCTLILRVSDHPQDTHRFRAILGNLKAIQHMARPKPNPIARPARRILRDAYRFLVCHGRLGREGGMTLHRPARPGRPWHTWGFARPGRPLHTAPPYSGAFHAPYRLPRTTSPAASA